MDEKDALFLAVCNNPDEDTPRLAYADWLDENGDPTRAKFIRLQCRMAALPDKSDEFNQLKTEAYNLLNLPSGDDLENYIDNLRFWGSTENKLQVKPIDEEILKNQFLDIRANEKQWGNEDLKFINLPKNTSSQNMDSRIKFEMRRGFVDKLIFMSENVLQKELKLTDNEGRKLHSFTAIKIKIINHGRSIIPQNIDLEITNAFNWGDLMYVGASPKYSQLKAIYGFPYENVTPEMIRDLSNMPNFKNLREIQISNYINPEIVAALCELGGERGILSHTKITQSFEEPRTHSMVLDTHNKAVQLRIKAREQKMAGDLAKPDDKKELWQGRARMPKLSKIKPTRDRGLDNNERGFVI